MLGSLRALASSMIDLVADAMRGVVGQRSRRAWTSDGRSYVEVRGGDWGPDSAGAEVIDWVEHLPGVRWVEVNDALGQLVIAHDPDALELAEVVNAVARAEEMSTTADTCLVPRVSHDGSSARSLSSMMLMGANLAGLGYALPARSLPIPALPPSVPAMVSTAGSVQWVDGVVRTHLGHAAADTFFGFGSAVANTLAQRSTTLLADASNQFCLLREAQAAGRSWARWEAEWGDRPEYHRCEPLKVGARPRALPNGPVETVTQVSTVAGPVAFLGSLGVTFDILRAQGFLVAGVPRAAAMGRDAFAAQLGLGFAERDVLVLDPGALRRMDRIDTVVLDASVVRTGSWCVRDVRPLNGVVGSAEVWERAHALIAAEQSGGGHGWTLSPLHGADGLPAEVWGQLELRARPGVHAFTLSKNARAVAVVEVEEELDALTDELLNAAREVGSVVLAGNDDALADRLGIDRVVPAGTELAEAVRNLQSEGRGVAVISLVDRAGLAAADLGVGVCPATGVPPWGAHMITDSGLGECCAVIRLIDTARSVSRRSAQLAAIGSASGAVLAMLGPSYGSQARAAVPVSTCALLGLGAGVCWGVQAARRPAPRAAPRTPWHAMSPATVLQRLGSSSGGLTDDAARERAAGQSDTSGNPDADVLSASLDELASPLTPALASGAGISASIGAFADAVIIVGVLGLNALIGGVQRVSADRALRRLVEASAVPVVLRRNGKTSAVVADDLVIGDVVELCAGDAVPADCRLFDADGLEVDESSLTGESQLVPKSTSATPAMPVADRQCMLYQGTAIAAGRATGIVVATGGNTEAASAGDTGEVMDRPGGVAARLHDLVKVTIPISIGAGAVLLIADMVRLQPFGAALGRAVSLAVAAVPEGLPFVATVAELAAARRLSRRGALVHNSSTIEALGRADVLGFDKTGTLTQGRIRLQEISDGRDSRALEELAARDRKTLAAALRASPQAENGEPLPHPTDRAVVGGARGLGVVPTEGAEGWQLVEELPFEPARGYHVVLGQVGEQHLLSVKGAPEVVLAECTYWCSEGEEILLDQADRESVGKEFERLARQGYRVLAVAERPASCRRELGDSHIRDLRLVGLIALADPVRPTAAAAVDELQRAGVQVVMITGDHPSTAEAIAAELNILNGHHVMTGPELDMLDDDELIAEVSDVAVFARASPAQKARIVRALQRNDRVVAVTGDGANDAPAIRLADIGIALGEQATPAAREAADVVVTDDRIETIVDAIVEGRAMWASVRDSLAVLLGGNLGEIGFTIVTGLITPGGSMNARQMLLVNLLTDVLPAMAIAVRPPPRITAEMLLAEGPEASLGSALIKDVYQRGVITGGAATVAWLVGRVTGTRRHADSVALVALVGAQLGQTLVIRGRTPLVVIGSLASMAVLAAIVQVPGVSHFFGCTPLWPHGWFIAVTSSATASTISFLLQVNAQRGNRPLDSLEHARNDIADWHEVTHDRASTWVETDAFHVRGTGDQPVIIEHDGAPVVSVVDLPDGDSDIDVALAVASQPERE